MKVEVSEIQWDLKEFAYQLGGYAVAKRSFNLPSRVILKPKKKDIDIKSEEFRIVIDNHLEAKYGFIPTSFEINEFEGDE